MLDGVEYKEVNISGKTNGYHAVCALLAAIVATFCLRHQDAAATPCANGFYVWQRDWSDKVEAAVRAELDAGTHDLYVLGGELEHEGRDERWRCPDVPKEILRHPRVTAVFRLPVRTLNDPGRSAQAVVSRAVALGVHRIQLDVDVPERQIVRYAELLEGIRLCWPTGSGAPRIGATLLPCHLEQKNVRRVLASADDPVIQLHGIDAPKNRAGKWALMDRKTVFRALRKARSLGGRFKMALPAYAYVLTFDSDGAFRRLYAEGLPDDFNLPAGTIRELAAPDLDLLHDILKPPFHLPVVWFRLPVRGADRWCLERETLSILERGERPVPTVEFQVRRGARQGTVDLIARYRHQIPLAGAAATIDWGSTGMNGEFFPLNGSRCEKDAVYGRLPESVHIPPFPCGEPFVFGKAIVPGDPRRISITKAENGK